jgi:hypothetical protein
MWDFWKWEYTYGHDLDFAHAIIKVPGMTYQPPLIGSKQLLNFTATSWPASGTFVLALAFVLGVCALVVTGPPAGSPRANQLVRRARRAWWRRERASRHVGRGDRAGRVRAA